MANQTKKAIQQLRRAVLLPDGAGLTDCQLLGHFIEGRDEAAFAALVRRHGPMVWGVCRRLLSHHDAEDAFQAAFLILARKASSVVPREMVANWLYGVAHQTALQARRAGTRRGARERQVAQMPEPAAVAEQDAWDDLRPLLDQELSRLPDKYRAVVVLSDLEGKTRSETARQLCLPEGTVASRLRRARAMLAKRLTRRGVVLSGGALAVVLSQKSASAGVPSSVVSSTIKAAGLFSAGQGAAAGVISAKVAALTEGVLKAMLFTKLKAVLAVVLILGLVATGTTILSCFTAAGQDDKKPTVEKPVEPAAEQQKGKNREAFTAWGKEVDGVQIGIQLGENRAYRIGESVTLIVRIRNNGKNEVPYSNGDSDGGEYFLRNPPLITDADGRPVKVKGMRPFTLIRESSIAPGKEADLAKLSLALRPTRDREKDEAWTLYGTGRFHVQYKDVSVVQLGSGGPTLTTGRLELEVKEADDKKPAAEKPVEPAAKREKEKEAFTAWGKEVGGVQAGLGFRPGERRPYHIGEIVTLVVRVRNVSREAVKFQYLRQFFMENPPTVIDGDGKPVQDFRYGTIDLSLIHVPVDVNLAPGKEIELYELKFKLRPASESVNEKDTPFYGTGKFQIQYERVFGNSSAGEITPDSALSKLATGRLELDVKDAAKHEKQGNEKEGFTAWGKEAGGLQAGLGYLPGQHRAYHTGETVTLIVRVRNVSKEPVKFQYIPKFFVENAPTVTDGDGKQVHFRYGFIELTEGHPKVDVNLAPGKEIKLGEVKLPTTLLGTGKFTLRYERVFANTWGATITLDPALTKLATGRLELDIKADPAAEDGKK